MTQIENKSMRANAYERGVSGIADMLGKRVPLIDRVSMAQDSIEWAHKLSVKGWQYNYNSSHGMLSETCFVHIIIDVLYECTASSSCPTPQVLSNALTIIFHNRKRLCARDDFGMKMIDEISGGKWNGSALTVMGDSTYKINYRLDTGNDTYDLINLYNCDINEIDWVGICPNPFHIDYCLREMLSDETYNLKVDDILSVYYRQCHENGVVTGLSTHIAVPYYDCDVEDIYEEYRGCFIHEKEETISIMANIRKNAPLVFNRIFAKRHDRYCAHFLRALIFPKNKKQRWLTGYGFPIDAVVKLIGMQIIKGKSFDNVQSEYRAEMLKNSL